MGRGRDPFAKVFGDRRGAPEGEQGSHRFSIEAEVDDALGLEEEGVGFIGYNPSGYATFHVSASSGRDAQEFFLAECSRHGQAATVVSVKQEAD